VTTHIESSLAALDCAVSPAISLRPRMSASQAHFGYANVAPPAGPASLSASVTRIGEAYGEHAQKRFSMARTDANVWPMGPQEGTSG
jgi:hypothetical protein